MSHQLFCTRRRFLSFSASLCGAGLIPEAALGYYNKGRNGEEGWAVWRGVVMGAPALIKLFSPDLEYAWSCIRASLSEIRRLEAIFSLHRRDSRISKLNDAGIIVHPPLDMIRLLSESKQISVSTKGAFDPTIQPLWQLYAEYFSTNPDSTQGPPLKDVGQVLECVDYRKLAVSEDRISLARRDMAVSLNGIAQGYVTDRIADLLRARNFENFAVDLGEPRLSGSHPSGRPWNVEIGAVDKDSQFRKKVEIVDRAVATSAGFGTPFEKTGRFHHLLDPRTGECANLYQSVTVIAQNATLADGLSTAFSIMTRREIERVRTQIRDIGVYILHLDNKWQSLV